MKMFGSVSSSQKADRSPVTEADHAVQDALLTAISKYDPGTAIICEEETTHAEAQSDQPRSRRCWVVDPIDGTRNYARQMAVFTVSVALMENGTPVIGWVYDPVGRRMYSASAGGGAWINETRVEVEDKPPTGDTMISVPTSRHEGLPPAVHRWIDTMLVRNLGSTALHLAMLGVGALDGVYCRKSKLWDIAGGGLIAMETGAQIVSPDGVPVFPIDLDDYAKGPLPTIAARPQVLERLLADFS